MQYSVPQFIDVEDKIFGPLTLKQFIVIIGGGVFGFLFWSILGPGLFFFAVMFPVVLVTLGLAFGKFNGLPVMSIFPILIAFFVKPRYRIFKRTGESNLIIEKTDDVSQAPQQTKKKLNFSERSSRLSKLAYVLDQQSAEEERLVREFDTKTPTQEKSDETL